MMVMSESNYSEERQLMVQKVQDFRKESEEHRTNRKDAVCKKCMHFGMNVCNYITDEGHQRPCAPSMCKKTGVFKPGKRRNVEQITLKP